MKKKNLERDRCYGAEERERERVVFGFNSLAKGKERKRDFLE